MSKKSKNNISKNKEKIVKIEKINKLRKGGQVALSGFSFQFLYSCFLILSSGKNDTYFELEGIEDIDKIKIVNNTNQYFHIQVKSSKSKQVASYLKNVLANFLEIYLIDDLRNFKLVYDFEISKGNLSKLVDNKLDDKANTYWKKQIENIKLENSNWNWDLFDYDKFINSLSFQKVDKDYLTIEIEKLLITNY